MPATAIFRAPKVQASLAIFLFVTAWWLGNGALFMSEFGGGVTASFIFPIAGAHWWAGYKISYPAHKSAMVIGFALLALWSFGLLAVFASYKYAPHLFFWVASATMALLITGIARIRPRPDPS